MRRRGAIERRALVDAASKEAATRTPPARGLPDNDGAERQASSKRYSYPNSGRGPALRDPFHTFSGKPREAAKPCVHKASPCGGGVGEADGGESVWQAITARIDDPRTPPTDRYAIASPTGGGF